MIFSYFWISWLVLLISIFATFNQYYPKKVKIEGHFVIDFNWKLFLNFK